MTVLAVPIVAQSVGFLLDALLVFGRNALLNQALDVIGGETFDRFQNLDKVSRRGRVAFTVTKHTSLSARETTW